MQPTTIASQLTEFLAQPNIEASPAWEFINGIARQKNLPTLFHSRLQRSLVNWINRNTDRYEAIQELRCIVPPLSPVPDIATIVYAASDLLPGLAGLPQLSVMEAIGMTQQR